MMQTKVSSKGRVSKLARELRQRDAELEIINSVQQGLASQLEVQAIYDLVGDGIRNIFDAQVVMISTYDSETETIEHRYAIERGERIYAPGKYPIRGFRTQIVETRKPVLVGENVAEIAARLGQFTLPGTITPKTWLGVPLIVENTVTGILSLQDVEEENAFDEGDVRFLETLAASMSIALENARLWEQEKLYRKALERELEIGREIQAGFLPKTLPRIKGWEIAASLMSAREVAGDFYDVFELPDGTLGLVIADVCDKGVGAALFMTLLRSLVRAGARLEYFEHSEAENVPISTAERLQRAISLTNNYITETHYDSGMFATLFFGILDPRDGKLAYINGGHLPPIIVRDGAVCETLTETGPAVGVVEYCQFEQRAMQLKPGDLLFAFTDGLPDCTNPQDEFFGHERMLGILRRESGSAQGLVKAIETELLQYISGATQFDDITLLTVRRQ
jgi:sigma-B regulation protein RsbU (phosphoserine phosphatase)